MLHALIGLVVLFSCLLHLVIAMDGESLDILFVRFTFLRLWISSLFLPNYSHYLHLAFWLGQMKHQADMVVRKELQVCLMILKVFVDFCSNVT